MALYPLLVIVPAALLLGFLAGLLLFKVKQRWCPVCGNHLRCVPCLYRAGVLTDLLPRPPGASDHHQGISGAPRRPNDPAAPVTTG